MHKNNDKITKSNITIPSNIYIRSENPVENDFDFVKQVAGENAIKIIDEKCSNISATAKLSQIQIEKLNKKPICNEEYNSLKEQTYGEVKIDDEIHWVCRCENKNCPKFNECMSYKYSIDINRDKLGNIAPEILENVSIKYNYLDCNIPEIEKEYKENKENIEDDITENIYRNAPIEDLSNLKLDISHQSKDLFLLSMKLEKILLNPYLETIKDTEIFHAKEQLKEFSTIIDNINHFMPEKNPDIKIGILCRNEQTAENVSNNLRRKCIKHILLRDEDILEYNSFIAQIFWDYHSDLMAKDDFINRYMTRISNNELEATKMLKKILEFSSKISNTNSLSKISILKALKENLNPPSELLANSYNNIVVSTIDKSKNEIYDLVYMVTNISTHKMLEKDELNLTYLATTRAKNKLVILQTKNKKYSISNKTLRTIDVRTNYGRAYCSRVAIGLKDDICSESFVSNDFVTSLELQNYIVNEVSPFDKIELILKNGIYNIVHMKNKKIIGMLHKKISEDIKNSISIQWESKNIPPRLYDLYVSNIVTTYEKNSDNNIPVQFKKSKFWIGITVIGFAKLDWHYKP